MKIFKIRRIGSASDHLTTLMASVDGVPILNLQEYPIQSPPFNFTLPHNNILGMPANITTEAVADGNWVFLKPLSPGVHKIIFKGEVRQSKIGGPLLLVVVPLHFLLDGILEQYMT